MPQLRAVEGIFMLIRGMIPLVNAITPSFRKIYRNVDFMSTYRVDLALNSQPGVGFSGQH